MTIKKYIPVITKIIIFCMLLSIADSIKSEWNWIPYMLVCGWFSWMVMDVKDYKEENERYNKEKNKKEEIPLKGLMKFECWDKKEKKFWGDFRIHPQGFVAPATAEKDGYWIYDWDYDQKKLELYIRTKDKKTIKII